jgi:hypothetical protein
MTFPLTVGIDPVTLSLEEAAVEAVLAAQAAIAAVGTLHGAPASLLAPAVLSVEAASTAIGAAIEVSDANTASGIEPGGDPAASVSYLNGQISTVSNTVSLLDARGYIDRVAINLALAQD